jgi:SAM-dependent methyltransferase
MRKDQDAFGQALWAHFKGRPSNHVIERDDLLVDTFESAGNYFTAEHEWHPVERKAARLARGSVLDIGCGAGRHAIHFQKRGLPVTGIDNSPLAVRVCRARGLKDARLLAAADVGKFPAETFDTVVMLGNNFGLFASAAGARSGLKKLHRITRPGAVLLAGSNDIYTTSDPAHRKYHTRNRSRGRMAGQVKIRVRLRHFVGEWFDYLMVSRKEMCEIVAETGWKVRRFIPSDRSGYVAVIDRT